MSSRSESLLRKLALVSSSKLRSLPGPLCILVLACIENCSLKSNLILTCSRTGHIREPMTCSPRAWDHYYIQAQIAIPLQHCRYTNKIALWWSEHEQYRNKLQCIGQLTLKEFDAPTVKWIIISDSANPTQMSRTDFEVISALTCSWVDCLWGALSDS
jgi:hypothetical protein